MSTIGEEQETGFIIDGKTYPIPTLDTLNMDEAQILYDYSGLTIEDFAPAGEDEDEEEILAARVQKAKNPAFLRALMHIAYLRGNPQAKAPYVKTVLGAINQMDVIEQYLLAAEQLQKEDEQQVPPAEEVEAEPPLDRSPSTSGRQPSSPRSSDESSESSGTPSPSSSTDPDDPQPSTGPLSLDTSSTSEQETQGFTSGQ